MSGTFVNTDNGTDERTECSGRVNARSFWIKTLGLSVCKQEKFYIVFFFEQLFVVGFNSSAAVLFYPPA